MIMYQWRTKHYPKPFKPSRWHEGYRYDIAVGNDLRDLSEYRSLVSVAIRDKKTGKIEYRSGDARMMGNFSPIWVKWKGESIQIEQLLDKR
jgi:hypothetical protein